MTRGIQPALIMTGGRYELWLCERKNGMMSPFPGTGPISLPPDWGDALYEADRQRELSRGAEYDAA